METYTQYGKEINSSIQSELDIIIKMLNKSITDIRSIILAGSYGKGEGKIFKKNKKIVYKSDYDLFVIIDKKIKKDSIKNILSNIKNALEKENPSSKTEYDIRFLQKNKLKDLAPTIRFYDLKYASKILYGEDCRKYIPDFQLKDISHYEGYRLLLNRLCFMSAWINKQKLEKDDRDTKIKILLEILKNYETSASALSIASKDYDPSIDKSMSNIKKHPDLKKYSDEISKGLKIEKELDNLDQKKIKKRFIESLKLIIEITEFYHKNIFNIINIKDDKKTYNILSKIYLKDYIRYASKKRLGFAMPWKPLAFLKQISENFALFKKQSKIKKIAYPKIFLDLKSPQIKLYFAVFNLMKNFSQKKHNMNNSLYFIKKLTPIENSIKEDELFKKIYDLFCLIFDIDQEKIIEKNKTRIIIRHLIN